jgi:hypothetical protein
VDRVRYLRLTVAVTVVVALAAAIGMSLVRSSGEGRGRSTTTAKEAREKDEKTTSAPTVAPGPPRPSRAPTRRPAESQSRRSSWSGRGPSRLASVALIIRVYDRFWAENIGTRPHFPGGCSPRNPLLRIYGRHGDGRGPS